MHERFSTEAAETDVAILGVWLDTESAGDLDAVLEYTGAAYPIVEFRNEMQNAVELQYILATIFLNKDGDIVGKPVIGALDAEGWLAEIEGRFKELE